MSKQYGVTIVGTGSALPEKILTNEELSRIVDTNDEWISSRTGIKERRIAEENMTTADLCVLAAEKAMKSANVTPEEIDLIIVPTISPEMIFPSTACIVQDRIQAKNAAAFDLSAGCTGFLYGLSTASQFIQNGVYETALVIGGETLSKFIDWEDRSTCVLFGDAAGAVVLKRTELENNSLLSVHLGSNGAGANLLSLPAGGSLNPASIETVNSGMHYLKMNGTEVFKFAVKKMEEATLHALELCGKTKEDIDFLIPHQANIRIIDTAVKRLKLSPDKVYINLDKYGNTSSASVPVALDEAIKLGKIKKGDIIVLVAFGAGLTWGASVIKWN